jgi:hypothetical protein
MTNHELKCDPEPFQALYDGRKNFEVRKCDDRTFSAGDTLFLREFNQINGQYTGRHLTKQVTYMVRGPHWGLPENVVVMSVAS